MCSKKIHIEIYRKRPPSWNTALPSHPIRGELYELRHTKKCLRVCAKYAVSQHPTYAAFATSFTFFVCLLFFFFFFFCFFFFFLFVLHGAAHTMSKQKWTNTRAKNRKGTATEASPLKVNSKRTNP